MNINYDYIKNNYRSYISNNIKVFTYLIKITNLLRHNHIIQTLRNFFNDIKNIKTIEDIFTVYFNIWFIVYNAYYDIYKYGEFNSQIKIKNIIYKKLINNYNEWEYYSKDKSSIYIKFSKQSIEKPHITNLLYHSLYNKGFTFAGNSCYIHSSFQLLYNMDLVSLEILSNKKPVKDEYNIYELLKSLDDNINNNSSIKISHNESLLKPIREHMMNTASKENPNLYDQHDAQELLHILLTSINKNYSNLGNKFMFEELQLNLKDNSYNRITGSYFYQLRQCANHKEYFDKINELDNKRIHMTDDEYYNDKERIDQETNTDSKCFTIQDYIDNNTTKVDLDNNDTLKYILIHMARYIVSYNRSTKTINSRFNDKKIKCDKFIKINQNIFILVGILYHESESLKLDSGHYIYVQIDNDNLIVYDDMNTTNIITNELGKKFYGKN